MVKHDHFYQDTLGTNIRNNSKTRGCFLHLQACGLRPSFIGLLIFVRPGFGSMMSTVLGRVMGKKDHWLTQHRMVKGGATDRPTLSCLLFPFAFVFQQLFPMFVRSLSWQIIVQRTKAIYTRCLFSAGSSAGSVIALLSYCVLAVGAQVSEGHNTHRERQKQPRS